MLRVGNYLELDKNQYDENWLIVRKPDELPGFVKYVPVLSPSPELFRKYRDAFHVGAFNLEFFDQVYVPQFLKELIENTEALSILQSLASVSKEKDILLACYCGVESMCHRSIIAGILLGMGAEIDAEPKYLKYYEQYQILNKK